jgi:hypothetical protein
MGGYGAVWGAAGLMELIKPSGLLAIRPQRDLAPQDRAPILPAFCSSGLLWHVVCGLGMRQPSHGCNVRFGHAVLFANRIGWLAITAADLRQARPVCSPDESRSRRYSPRATSRSMPELPPTKYFHDEGWIRRDLPSCFIASLGFKFARCAYANERTPAHEAPRLHRRKSRWH